MLHYQTPNDLNRMLTVYLSVRSAIIVLPLIIMQCSYRYTVNLKLIYRYIHFIPSLYVCDFFVRRSYFCAIYAILALIWDILLQFYIINTVPKWLLYVFPTKINETKWLRYLQISSFPTLPLRCIVGLRAAGKLLLLSLCLSLILSPCLLLSTSLFQNIFFTLRATHSCFVKKFSSLSNPNPMKFECNKTVYETTKS